MSPPTNGDVISENGGATKSVPRIVKPRLNHRFSFWLSGDSIINVYLIRTERNSNVVMLTYFDRESEKPYAVSAIYNANAALNVLYDAAENYQTENPNKPNPFRQFIDSNEFEVQMMREEFINVLSHIFYKGEWI